MIFSMKIYKNPSNDKQYEKISLAQSFQQKLNNYFSYMQLLTITKLHGLMVNALFVYCFRIRHFVPPKHIVNKCHLYSILLFSNPFVTKISKELSIKYISCWKEGQIGQCGLWPSDHPSAALFVVALKFFINILY